MGFETKNNLIRFLGDLESAACKKNIELIHITAGELCLQCFDAVGWAAGRASSL